MTDFILFLIRHIIVTLTATLAYSKSVFFTMDKYVFSVFYKHGFNFAIAKGRLPKGTKYTINKSGEIISSNIIIDEFINL